MHFLGDKAAEDRFGAKKIRNVGVGFGILGLFVECGWRGGCEAALIPQRVFGVKKGVFGQ